MKVKEHGGKRRGAGRKPIPEGDRKVTVSFYPQKSKVEKVGYERAQDVALMAFEKEFKKS